jgi:hypothetical protein
MFVMKKIFLISSFTFFIVLTSCGPAAEDKQLMHERAKVFQDSIATMIRTSMAEAEAPGNVVVMPQPTATPASTPSTEAKK